VIYFSDRKAYNSLDQFHTIFDDNDPDAELHSEDELDSPIIEEELGGLVEEENYTSMQYDDNRQTKDDGNKDT